MDGVFPEPTLPAATRAVVFLGYLDYFRTRVITKVENLSDSDRRLSQVPSGWTPLELIKHLTFAELRWFEWGFAGRSVEDPWGDDRNGRWYVSAEETAEDLISTLREQATPATSVTSMSWSNSPRVNRRVATPRPPARGSACGVCIVVSAQPRSPAVREERVGAGLTR